MDKKRYNQNPAQSITYIILFYYVSVTLLRFIHKGFSLAETDKMLQTWKHVYQTHTGTQDMDTMLESPKSFRFLLILWALETSLLFISSFLQEIKTT